MDVQRKPSYLESLAFNLLKASQQNNLSELNILLHQLSEAVNIPGDISCLIGPVVKLIPCHNVEVKTAAYSILPRICQLHSEAALLVANTILCDAKDPNPVVKCLAISTLASIPALHQEHAYNTLCAGLHDGNPRVRLAAVSSCGKVYKHSPDLIRDQGFVDRLYGCIRDSDPVIVTSSLIVLDTILATEGGVVVNRGIAGYLLRRLADFPDPQLATVLQVLLKYAPSDEEELFHELSLLDPYLVCTTSSAVVVNCVLLFLQLTHTKYPQLKHEIIQRSFSVLKQYMSTKFSKESISRVLDFLLEMHTHDTDWLLPFCDTPQLFFPKENADISVAIKQLQLLPFVSNAVNCRETLQVLYEKYCKDLGLGVYAMKCVTTISKLVESAESDCLNLIISLLDCKTPQVSNNVLEILQDMNLSNFDKKDIDLLLNKVISKTDFMDGKHYVPFILPRLLGDFGYDNQNCEYVLESLAENFDYYAEELKLLVLVCSVKLFLHQPAKYQHTLGKIMEKCICNKNSESGMQPSLQLNHKAKKYYKLLNNNVDLVKSILLVQ